MICRISSSASMRSSGDLARQYWRSSPSLSSDTTSNAERSSRTVRTASTQLFYRVHHADTAGTTAGRFSLQSRLIPERRTSGLATKPRSVIAIYPGSFDPITNGHLDLIDRGSRLVDRLIVAILRNEAKQPLFTVEERIEMLQEVLTAYPNVEVDSFHGLLVDYARERGATVLLRGIRAISDYVEELQMALMNRRLNAEVETIFMMSGEAYSFISSRLVKEVASLGANVSGLVPPSVEVRLKNRVIKTQRQER